MTEILAKIWRLFIGSWQSCLNVIGIPANMIINAKVNKIDETLPTDGARKEGCGLATLLALGRPITCYYTVGLVLVSWKKVLTF